VKDHHFKIDEARWLWRYSRLKGSADGWTDWGKKKVLIDDRLAGRARLETEIHEAIHAGMGPAISEGTVTSTARDAARILWSLGYRLVPKE
jgi:hypothetical protein